MLLVDLIGRMVLVLVGISLLAVPVLWLLLKPALLLIGGSLLIFRFLLAFVLVPGWLMLLARLLVSPFGLLVDWIFLIGPLRRPLVWFRMSGMSIEMNLGWFLMMLYLLLGMLSPDLLWMTSGAFGVVMRRLVSYTLAGGPTTAGSSAFLGGGQLFRRRLKSVADVLKGIKSKGFTQTRWDALFRYWVLFVVMVLVVLSPLFIPGMIGFLLISMASTSGCLSLLRC